MSRTLPIAFFLIAVLAILAGGAGLVLYLSYGVDTSPPRREYANEIGQRVEVHWSEHGSVRIQAESTSDFVFSLGYAHGMNRTWLTLLSRQIALGRLSEWLGKEAFPVDRLSKRLAFAASARDSYDALAPDIQNRYERYADGVNLALSSEPTRRLSPFVLLEVEPEMWEPWHALAVERLWSWISASTSSLPDSVDGVIQLRESDHALRTRLHLFGFEDNMVVAAGGGTNLRHLFRYVTGDSGQPVFQEFEYADSGGPVMDGISIPGTIAVPAGRTGSLSWTYLLHSEISVQTVKTGPQAEVVVSYARIRDQRGMEEVVQLETLGGEPLIDGAASDDSIRSVLRWTGYGGTGDGRAWSQLIDGIEPTFTTINNDGIVVRGSDLPEITGNSNTSYSHPSGVRFASNAEYGAALVDRLETIISGQTEVQTDWDLLHDTFSSAAASRIASFVEAVDSLRSRTVREDNAVEYLKNWDHSYRGSSIAASILETAEAYLTVSPVDSLTPDLAGSALAHAVSRLTEQYGPDMREWRWESVQDLTVYYPGWSETAESDDYLVRQFKEEFVPVAVTGRGHPSTLAWGPTLYRQWRKAPSAWEGLFGQVPGSIFEFERPSVAYASFLGRFLAENRATVDVTMDFEAATSHRTELIPRE